MDTNTSCQEQTDCGTRYACYSSVCLCNSAMLYGGDKCEQTHLFVKAGFAVLATWSAVLVVSSAHTLWAKVWQRHRIRFNASVTATTLSTLAVMSCMCLCVSNLSRALNLGSEKIASQYVSPFAICFYAFFTVLSLLNVCMLWVELASSRQRGHSNIKGTRKFVIGAGALYLTSALAAYLVTFDLNSVILVNFAFILLLSVCLLVGSIKLAEKLEMDLLQAEDTLNSISRMHPIMTPASFDGGKAGLANSGASAVSTRETGGSRRTSRPNKDTASASKRHTISIAAAGLLAGGEKEPQRCLTRRRPRSRSTSSSHGGRTISVAPAAEKHAAKPLTPSRPTFADFTQTLAGKLERPGEGLAPHRGSAGGERGLELSRHEVSVSISMALAPKRSNGSIMHPSGAPPRRGSRVGRRSLEVSLASRSAASVSNRSSVSIAQAAGAQPHGRRGSGGGGGGRDWETSAAARSSVSASKRSHASLVRAALAGRRRDPAAAAVSRAARRAGAALLGIFLTAAVFAVAGGRPGPRWGFPTVAAAFAQIACSLHLHVIVQGYLGGRRGGGGGCLSTVLLRRRRRPAASQGREGAGRRGAVWGVTLRRPRSAILPVGEAAGAEGGGAGSRSAGRAGHYAIGGDAREKPEKYQQNLTGLTAQPESETLRPLVG